MAKPAKVYVVACSAVGPFLKGDRVTMEEFCERTGADGARFQELVAREGVFEEVKPEPKAEGEGGEQGGE